MLKNNVIIHNLINLLISIVHDIIGISSCYNFMKNVNFKNEKIWS